jgi:hypothetical protein
MRNSITSFRSRPSGYNRLRYRVTVLTSDAGDPPLIEEEENTTNYEQGARPIGTPKLSPPVAATRLWKILKPVVQDEEFAKQLRLARYLAGASLPPSRPLEPVAKSRRPFWS